MNNVVKFPSQSEQDEKVFETMKEFEYTSYNMNNIYIHWGKERGLRAEMEPALNKITIIVNEEGNRAWIYIHDWDGTEFKYVLEPKLFPMLGLIISDDVNQLVGSNIYELYYIYLHYVLGFYTEKIVEHNKDYLQHIKDMYRRISDDKKYIKDRDFFLDLISFNVIEKFD